MLSRLTRARLTAIFLTKWFVSVLIAFYPIFAIEDYSNANEIKKCRDCAKATITKKKIMMAETLLADRGYWTGPVDGILDETSRQALIAFQKMTGRTPNGRLTDSEIRAIKSAPKPHPRFPQGFHLEIDLTKQLLLIVDEGLIKGIIAASTGSGKEFTDAGWTRRAITPVGRFKVERKIEGVRSSPLGLMHYPMYINGGVAIHGSQFIAVGPATHGCIAIPIDAAESLSKATPLGTEIVVYGKPPRKR